MKNKKQNKTKKQVKQVKPVVAKKAIVKKATKKVAKKVIAVKKPVAPKCAKKCAKKCEGKCAKKCARKVTTKTVKINGKNVPMHVAEKDGLKITVVGPIPMKVNKVPEVSEKELEYEVKEMTQVSIIMNLARVFDFGPLPKRNALRKISTDRFRQIIGSYARIAKFFGGVYENIKKDYDEFVKIASVWKADSKQK